MPTLEELGPLIIDTLQKTPQEAAKYILDKGKLTNLTEEEVMSSIKNFREKRTGLEGCCKTILSIYRRKNNTDSILDLHISDFEDYGFRFT